MPCLRRHSSKTLKYVNTGLSCEELISVTATTTATLAPEGQIMKKKLKPLRASTSRSRTSTSSDPLSQIVAAQLATETPQARGLRLQAESEARDASLTIDHSLEQDRRMRHLGQGAMGLPPNQYTSPRTRRVLLLLLLGPSNAGKTCVLDCEP